MLGWLKRALGIEREYITWEEFQRILAKRKTI